MINKDLNNANLYVLNGIICDYFDNGIKPTLNDIKTNWQMEFLHLSFGDDIILDMIKNVSKFYK